MKKLAIIFGIIVFTISTLLQIYIVAEYINPLPFLSDWFIAMIVQFAIFAIINSLLLFITKKIFKHKKGNYDTSR